MVGPRFYHVKYTRAYPCNDVAQDTAAAMESAVQWLKECDFHTHRKGNHYTRGSQKGFHVNFVPKYKLYVEEYSNGSYIVKFDYFVKLKLGTAVVVGILTNGISAAVGVGALAVNLAEADHFADNFWKFMDSRATGTPQTLMFERWASDGKGNFVQTTSPVETPGVLPPTPPQKLSPSSRIVPILPGQVYGHQSVHVPRSLESNPTLYLTNGPYPSSDMYSSDESMNDSDESMNDNGEDGETTYPAPTLRGQANPYNSSGNHCPPPPPRRDSTRYSVDRTPPPPPEPPVRSSLERTRPAYTRSLGMPSDTHDNVNSDTRRLYKRPSVLTSPEPRMETVA